MPSHRSPFSLAVLILLRAISLCFAGDQIVEYEFKLSYITASPLGVPQQVIAVNGQFPGPTINVTINSNVSVNVWNDLDEEAVLFWNRIDGVLGANSPIPPAKNLTYLFQVKDPIGSLFYFPSEGYQIAAGGFGPIIVNNRPVIPIPFRTPDEDINIFIGVWYIRSHKSLQEDLDADMMVGVPDGVLINGKEPYRYNQTLVAAGIEYCTIVVEPGKTYRFRVHNVGISTRLNFRIQNHKLFLVEKEDANANPLHKSYQNFDIGIEQSYSFLVSMNQTVTTDLYIVASADVVDGSSSEWERVAGVAILKYSNSKGSASGPLPPVPNDKFHKERSIN